MKTLYDVYASGAVMRKNGNGKRVHGRDMFLDTVWAEDRADAVETVKKELGISDTSSLYAEARELYVPSSEYRGLTATAVKDGYDVSIRIETPEKEVIRVVTDKRTGGTRIVSETDDGKENNG